MKRHCSLNVIYLWSNAFEELIGKSIGESKTEQANAFEVRNISIHCTNISSGNSDQIQDMYHERNMEKT